MTLDEAIEIFNSDKSETILNLSELRSGELARWLEELKTYRETKEYLIKEIRADAFEEFINLYKIFQIAPIEDICNNKNIPCYGECIECFKDWLKEQNNV